jgi:hypothetical protein
LQPERKGRKEEPTSTLKSRQSLLRPPFLPPSFSNTVCTPWSNPPHLLLTPHAAPCDAITCQGWENRKQQLVWPITLQFYAPLQHGGYCLKAPGLQAKHDCLPQLDPPIDPSRPNHDAANLSLKSANRVPASCLESPPCYYDKTTRYAPSLYPSPDRPTSPRSHLPTPISYSRGQLSWNTPHSKLQM